MLQGVCGGGGGKGASGVHVSAHVPKNGGAGRALGAAPRAGTHYRATLFFTSRGCSSCTRHAVLPCSATEKTG